MRRLDCRAGFTNNGGMRRTLTAVGLSLAIPFGLLSAPLVHAQSGRCLTAPPTPSPPPTPTPPPPPTPPPAAPTQVWAKPLASGAVAIVLLNRGKAPANITADFAAIEAATGLPLRVCDVLDIWANETSLGVMASQVTAHVAGTSAAFYKLVPKE